MFPMPGCEAGFWNSRSRDVVAVEHLPRRVSHLLLREVAHAGPSEAVVVVQAALEVEQRAAGLLGARPGRGRASGKDFPAQVPSGKQIAAGRAKYGRGEENNVLLTSHGLV